MSEIPETELTPAAPPAVSAGPGWFHRVTSILFIIFCFELGLFLLIYPWTSSWSQNYFAWLVPGAYQLAWHAAWTNTGFRGGISGIGAANLWIAVAEVFHLFSRGEN